MTGEIAKSLQAGEHCVTAALKAANLGLWDWNVSSGEVRVDGTFCSFIGREPDNLTLTLEELTALVHEEDRESSRQAMRDALRGTTSKLQMMQRLRHADGRWVWIDTCGVVTERGADGRVTRVTGTHTEITERKQMESALSNTLRVMRTLLETLPLPVILRDTERRVTLVNAACEQMMRLPRDAIVGRLLAEIPNRPPVRGHQETDDQVFATKKPLRYETTIQAPDGTSFDVIVAKTPLTAEDGSITGIASVTTDISDQKRTAQVLERARLAAEAAMQAKSRFLANMSHELRTPLNGVVGMTSLLESTPLDSRQRRFVRTLRSSAEALITLINDILDLSKAEAGKLELADAPFDLRRELEQVVGLFSARAHDKGIDVAAHIARDVPATVRGDALRLRQVLGNLVNNAVKFTESGAVLLAVKVAEARDPGLYLEFSVTDSGIGIAPDVQQRIFDAFEQADGSVTRKFGGTGLGLAISRQLIELMRGSMHLSSEPGRGSRFSFVIPAGVPRADPRPARRVPHSCALLIGIHPVIRDAVRDTLGTSHEQVVEADAVPQALELLRNLDPRLTRLRVLLDSAASDAFGPMTSAVQAIRSAAGSRHPELVVLLPPDAEIRPINGAARTLIKPLCTLDLVAEAATFDAGHTLSVRAIPARGSRGRALVVEDNAVNQEVARTMLDMMGFEVITASNGQEGVLAAAAHPDLRLILMDCQMPVMDGLAAARAIRAAAISDWRVPIVALTGNAMPGDREACIAAGMDDYLAKPFSLTALRNAVDRWAPVEAPAALTDKA